jgi:acyl-CoA thioesterase YciA
MQYPLPDSLRPQTLHLHTMNHTQHPGEPVLIHANHEAVLAPNVALPTDKELVLKVVPMPADCNANGDIFGGWVMAQVDIAGAIVPARYTRGRMATVAVNQFIFKQPVRVGDILSFFAGVTRIGNTSITVQVEVFAERFTAQQRYIKVTEASLTYVAIDSSGRPRPVPKTEAEANAQ